MIRSFFAAHQVKWVGWLWFIFASMDDEYRWRSMKSSQSLKLTRQCTRKMQNGSNTKLCNDAKCITNHVILFEKRNENRPNIKYVQMKSYVQPDYFERVPKEKKRITNILKLNERNRVERDFFAIITILLPLSSQHRLANRKRF